MSHLTRPNAELIEYVDAWIEENAWRLDDRLIDFALDVRLMAAGTPVLDTPQPVATMAGV